VAVREDLAVARREEVSSFIFMMICRLLGSLKSAACPEIVRLITLALPWREDKHIVTTSVQPEAEAGEQQFDHAASAGDLSC